MLDCVGPLGGCDAYGIAHTSTFRCDESGNGIPRSISIEMRRDAGHRVQELV